MDEPPTTMASMDDISADEVLFAPAKLTLSLRVVGVRADGYHLIDAEMVSLDVGDSLHLRAGDDLEAIDAESGAPIDLGSVSDNLITRALRVVDRRRSVRVTKRIPAGAGLGGGSADAAAVLRWAGFTDLQRAASLGADVPFCMVGGRARVTGIGEVVEPLPFVEQVLTLWTPPLACSTPAVYRAWDELGGPVGEQGNDLEPAALVVEPALARWRDELAAVSGQRPRLAGSGSTWFVEGSHPGEGRVVVRTTPAT
jgi:4-diphosphocytidyl-2-C-methyl-D-erythritol kinase